MYTQLFTACRSLFGRSKIACYCATWLNEKVGAPPDEKMAARSRGKSGGRVLLLDGGLATELEKRGHAICVRRLQELW